VESPSTGSGIVYQKERRKILTPLPLGTNYINGRLDIEISEMSPKEREEKINALTDSQAISISKLIKDTLVLTRLPKDYSVDKINAVDAVYELYKESDYGAIDRKEIERYIKQSNQDSVGKIAKDFLLFLDVVADKDLLQELDQELASPPEEEVAVLEPVSLLVVVFGGIALLNVISNIRYKDGKFEYDPHKGIEVTKQNIKGVVNILKAIIPAGRKEQ